MALDELMGVIGPATTHAEAAAAIAAKLQFDASGDADPAVGEHLDRVIAILGVGDAIAGLDEQERRIATGFARAFLHFASDLADNPCRTDGWSFTDPVILNSLGGASQVIASLIASTGYDKADARILDIGSGVSFLSIAFCNVFPQSTVVGLEPWEPSRQFAHANIEAFAMQERITVAPTTIEDFTSDTPFDLIWLPCPFLSPAVLDDAISSACALAAPRASVVLGTFGESGDALDDELTDLRTVRAGGTPIKTAEAASRLEQAGLVDVRVPPRTWNAPVGLIIGRRD